MENVKNDIHTVCVNPRIIYHEHTSAHANGTDLRGGNATIELLTVDIGLALGKRLRQKNKNMYVSDGLIIYRANPCPATSDRPLRPASLQSARASGAACDPAGAGSARICPLRRGRAGTTPTARARVNPGLTLTPDLTLWVKG